MLRQSEQRFVGVIDGRVGVLVAAVGVPGWVTIVLVLVLVVGGVLINARDPGMPRDLGRDLAQRVMRRRHSSRHQGQQRG